MHGSRGIFIARLRFVRRMKKCCSLSAKSFLFPQPSKGGLLAAGLIFCLPALKQEGCPSPISCVSLSVYHHHHPHYLSHLSRLFPTASLCNNSIFKEKCVLVNYKTEGSDTALHTASGKDFRFLSGFRFPPNTINGFAGTLNCQHMFAFYYC